MRAVCLFLCLQVALVSVVWCASPRPDRETFLAPQTLNLPRDPLFQIEIGDLLSPGPNHFDVIVVSTNRRAVLTPGEWSLIDAAKEGDLISEEIWGEKVGSGLDGRVWSKVEKKNARGVTFIPTDVTRKDNVVSSRGFDSEVPDQRIFYIPITMKNEGKSSREGLFKRILRVFLEAKNLKAGSVAFSGIGGGAYDWTMNDVVPLIQKAALQTRFFGKVCLCIRPGNGRATRRVQEARRAAGMPPLYEDLEVPPGEVVSVFERLVDWEAGIHLRPSLRLWQFFNQRNIKVLRVERINAQGKIMHPEEDVIDSPQDSDHRHLVYQSLAVGRGDRIRFHMVLPPGVREEAFQEELEKLFAEELSQYRKRQYPTVSLEGTLDFIPAFGGHKILINPRFVIADETLVIGRSIQPILYQYISPRERGRERLRFLVAKSRFLVSEGEPGPVLRDNLVEKTGEVLRENPHFNAEWAVSEALHRLLDEYEREIRPTVISGMREVRTLSGMDTREQNAQILTYLAHRLVGYLRTPFGYGLGTNPFFLEGLHSLESTYMANFLDRWLSSIHHFETDQATQSFIEDTLTQISDETTLRTRQRNEFPWTLIMEDAEELFAAQREEARRTGRDPDALSPAHEIIRFIFKIHLLSWLGQVSSEIPITIERIRGFIGRISREDLRDPISRRFEDFVLRVQNEDRLLPSEIYEWIWDVLGIRSFDEEQKDQVIALLSRLLNFTGITTFFNPSRRREERPVVFVTDRHRLEAFESSTWS